MSVFFLDNFLAISLCLLAYLMGSISSAISVCQLLRLKDPRAIGSGNPGASNVLRNHGKFPAALTFAGDIIKVILPICVGILLELPLDSLGWIACSACIGHMYPIYYQFAGGKGVASAFGAIFLLFWPLGIVLGLLWIALAKLSGTASIGSITAWFSAPILLFFWQPELWPSISCISALILYRHKSNIERLLQGNENRLS